LSRRNRDPDHQPTEDASDRREGGRVTPSPTPAPRSGGGAAGGADFTIKDGRVSFRVGGMITLIATLVSGVTSVGGVKLVERFTGPNAKLEAQVTQLQKDLEAEKKVTAEALGVSERTLRLVLKIHKIETVIDGRPVDLEDFDLDP
jgi:hypothetical protein